MEQMPNTTLGGHNERRSRCGPTVDFIAAAPSAEIAVGDVAEVVEDLAVDAGNGDVEALLRGVGVVGAGWLVDDFIVAATEYRLVCQH